jgi:hypothetical protein
MTANNESRGADTLFAEVLRDAAQAAGAHRTLESHPLDESQMIELLHRAVPTAFLEAVAATSPWAERPRVLGAIVLNPKTPRPLAQRLLAYLYWRDLADAAVSPRVEGGVRARAEGLLKDKLVELRLGEKITLARLAPPSVLRLLLHESDRKILDAALLNPRLRESDLVPAIEAADAPRLLLEVVPESARWRESYAVRLALALQPRTPLAVALLQLTSLTPRDLARLAQTPGIPLLLQTAAARLAPKPPRG